MFMDDLKQKPFFTIGVTGGIGSGKSTVCNILKDLGCEIFNADQVAKSLQETDPEVIMGLKTIFGNDIYPKEGESQIPDRKQIAAIIFKDPEKLQAVNKLIHPKVFQAFEAAKKEARQKGAQVLIKEAAILFESGANSGLDKVIVVAADPQTRIARVKLGSLLSEEAIRARMANQWSQEKLAEKADFVIYNNGSLLGLQKDAKEVLGKILEPVKA